MTARLSHSRLLPRTAMPRFPILLALDLALAGWLLTGTLLAAEPTPEQVQFFESKIRPILVENCHRCHGEKKQSGNLRLDSAGGLLAGGDSGPPIVAGKPEESLLIEAIKYESLEMPPDARLKPEQVALITEWVKIGAPWPGGGGGDVALQPRKEKLVVTDADRQHWSFQPIRQNAPPEIQNSEFRIRNSIDSFIRAKLTEKGLQPSPEATKRTLIRRAYFDLTGLPPSAESVAAFESDNRPDAYERLIDRLLASPQHGQRWGRHWLDVVRFAQTNGYERDSEKPLAWRYRDYIIRAFNHDKPYDQFLIEQLAGDELTPVTDDSLTATAYYRLGVWDDEPDDGKQAKADEFDDIVSTTSAAMLGLTLGCARCHDHKFDPLGQEDYYAFTAFFQNIHLYGKMADVVGGGQPIDKEGVFRPLPSGAGETLCVRERDEAPPESFVLIRGNAHTPGKEVQPRFIEVLCDDPATMTPALPEKDASSPSSRGRRLALARWIARDDNPLTARVAVNRLWKHHFGRGIVATPSDFGHTGLAPSHPELLDHLASELVRGDWRLKRMHRRILESATYRQSSNVEFGMRNAESQPSTAASIPHSALRTPHSIDPDNTLLWRQNMRRLEAEAIRDSVLAASGELNLEMEGRGIFPALPPEVLAKQSRPGSGWDKSSPADQARRSVYIFVKRTLGVPLLESFDVASPDSSIAQRSTTTIAPQALLLLNSDFMQKQAAALARRVGAVAEPDPASQIDAAYRFALGREPTNHERQIGLAFLERETERWSAVKATQLAAGDTGEQLLGWKQFGGQWRKSEGGGCHVASHPGAKIVRDGLSFENGTVEAQVMLQEGSGDAGLIVRVSEPTGEVNGLAAYNINLRKDALRLGKHKGDWQPLASQRMVIKANEWHDLKVEFEGGRIRVWLDGAKEPQIDFTDEQPLAAGSVGFRTFQVDAAVRQIRIRKGDEVEDVPMEYSQPAVPADTIAADRALVELCKLVLNLNEFVYID